MTTQTNDGIRLVVRCRVNSLKEVGNNIFVLRFRSPELASATRPGQFVNIRVSQGDIPLLRRPFSVYRTEGDEVEIIFNAVGTGTSILSKKRAGDEIDVLGPLGVPYHVDGDYEYAILIAGGLGVAPLPILTGAVRRHSKKIATLLGARTSDQLVTNYLDNVSVATDDGSRGFHGTVVDLAAMKLRDMDFSKIKIFACGPNAMLKNITALASLLNITAEISVECAMACGFGICQGCPVERNHGEEHADGTQRRYYLVCKDGPVFNTNEITLG
jgi:dihydroorotate dehydrogenase electron transfer subunit